MQVIINHIFIEANRLPGSLANTTLEYGNFLQGYTFQQLPVEGNKILNIDKAQMSTLRIRSRKIK